MRNVNIPISSNLDTLQACVVINIGNESSELWSKRTIFASKRLSDKADFGDSKKCFNASVIQKNAVCGYADC